MAKPKLALIPSGYSDGKIYSILPSNGDGDFTTTRASKATRINKDGFIENVDSGIPRLDYPLIDGVVSGCPSLLLEPQRTNLITQSEAFDNAYWTKSSSSVTSGFISPTGGLDAFKLVADANSSAAAHSIYSTGVSITNGVSYTGKVYLKYDNQQYIRVGFGSTGSMGLVLDKRTAVVDLINGTIITTTTSPATAKITSLSNGFYEVAVSTISAATGITSLETSITDSSGSNIISTGAESVYIYGAQLEEGSYATSYIKTEGSTVTRIADACSQTPPDGVIGQAEGTLYCEIDFANTSGVAGAWSISDGSSANRITINTIGSSSTEFALSIAQNYSSGSTKLASANVTYGDKHKVAIKYSATTLKLFIDGQLVDSVLTDGFGNFTNFYLGGNQNGVGGDARKFIQADLYNTALTDAELITLTS